MNNSPAYISHFPVSATSSRVQGLGQIELPPPYSPMPFIASVNPTFNSIVRGGEMSSSSSAVPAFPPTPIVGVPFQRVAGRM